MPKQTVPSPCRECPRDDTCKGGWRCRRFTGWVGAVFAAMRTQRDALRRQP